MVDATQKLVQPIGSNSDLVSNLVEAGVVDVSSLSRLMSSRKLLVIEDKNQKLLKSLDKATGEVLFSSRSDHYVLSAEGVGNFPNIAELGKIIKNLTTEKFDITFLQDRDGLPDFLVDPLIKSQNVNGVEAKLLGRHEIESYLIEPSLIMKAAKKNGRTIKSEYIIKAILVCGPINN